jgi:hypothetical protein
MPFSTQSQQVKKEEYAKTQATDIVRSIITNTPRKAKTQRVNIDELTIKQKQELSKFTLEEYEVMSKSVPIRRMMARFLETDEKLLTAICKSANNVKKQIDSAPTTLKEKRRANTSPIKEVAPEFIRELAALTTLTGKVKAITIRHLPDDAINLITKKYKLLLKYELIPSVPLHRINWSFFSLNPNAIDYLSLPANKKRIDYSQLSKNINSKALELIKAELMRNPYNPDIDWSALSGNPEAIDILDANRDKIEWAYFAGNTNPKVIQIIKENQIDIASRGYMRDANIYWYTMSKNTSTEAIDFLTLPENYNKIFWDFLSANTNPKAIALLTKKEGEENDLDDAEFNRLKTNEKISWANLSRNPKAISLLKNKWEDEKVLLRSDIEQYNILKKKKYIIHWNILSENPNAIDLLREKIAEENKLPKKDYDRLENIEKIDWAILSANQKAIQILEENPGKINWNVLSANQNAIELLEAELLEAKLKKYPNNHKINWYQLSGNPKAIKLLQNELKEKPNDYENNIVWEQVSQNPEAIKILDVNKDKIVWPALSKNPNAGKILNNRIEFENKIPKKKYNEIAQQYKLNWKELSKNPAIFTLT